MPDTNLRFGPLKPEEEKFLTRAQVCARWSGCSEKAVLRAEKRLGLKPYRILRGIRYALSDIMRIEAVSDFSKLHAGKGGFWEDRGYEWYAGI